MPEPNLHLLFTQLQTRYPTSGLITEFVQVHADRFVVRSLVQLGSITLATSMAAATTIEQAEEQAQLRVLALLGIQPVTVASLSDLPFSSYSVPTPLTDAPKHHPVADSLSSGAIEGFSATQLPTMTAAIDHLSLPARSLEPLTPAATMLQTTPTDGSEDYTAAENDVEPALDSFEGAALELPDHSNSPSKVFEEEPFEEAFEEELFENDLVIEPDSPLLTVPELSDRASDAPASSTPPETGAKTKPQKTKTKTTTEPPALDSSPSPVNESRDLSSLISQIGVEIDRIGWSKRQGSTYLQKTYSKKTRSELTDDELEDFLNYLNVQPSAGQGEN